MESGWTPRGKYFLPGFSSMIPEGFPKDLYAFQVPRSLQPILEHRSRDAFALSFHS